MRERSAAERIARGHPWVWRDALDRGIDDVACGEEVRLRGPDGTPLGHGLADPGSPIAVRMWTHGDEPMTPHLWETRCERACKLRDRLFRDTRTDAFRVLHGEGDRVPGFVADRYGPVVVVRTDGDGAAARLDDLVGPLWSALRHRGVTTLAVRTGARGQTVRVEGVRGAPLADVVRVEEHGVPFLVDLARGQKTGAFLDQRENRRRVGELARGRRVLNLFSYAGGFSLTAALGGASHVTSVDVAAAAHATAQLSFRAAGVDPRAHAFVTADVTSFLDGARARGERWDLVVSDPPSFAPNERAVSRALAAYRSLHRACAAVLASDGILCAASCSSHVDAGAFLGTLDDASLGRSMGLIELAGAGPDHPTLAAFPEGRYLKFAILT